MHDSQVVEDILDPDNMASDVWAESAYRSAAIEAKLEENGLESRIHRKSHRNKPLSEREKQGNMTRSQVRARVEHVFDAQSNDMGGTLVRGMGLVRAKARIGLKNLTYNMRRLVQLERHAMAGAHESFAGGVCRKLALRGKLPRWGAENPPKSRSKGYRDE
jgi:IS5 family transposase